MQASLASILPSVGRWSPARRSCAKLRYIAIRQKPYRSSQRRVSPPFRCSDMPLLWWPDVQSLVAEPVEFPNWNCSRRVCSVQIGWIKTACAKHNAFEPAKSDMMACANTPTDTRTVSNCRETGEMPAPRTGVRDGSELNRLSNQPSRGAPAHRIVAIGGEADATRMGRSVANDPDGTSMVSTSTR